MSYLAKQITDRFQNPIENGKQVDFPIESGEKCEIGEQFWVNNITDDNLSGMYEVIGVSNGMAC